MSNEEHIPQEQTEEIKVGVVGGEALMEGIMMRGPEGAAVSIRRTDGSIETSLKQIKMPVDRCKAFGWPLIRGPVSLVYSMVFGYKCMMESAEKATEGLMESGEVVAESKLDKWLEANFGPKMMAVITGIGVVLGIGVAMLLFVWAPERLAGFIHDHATVDISRFMPLISGGVRVVLFVGYMFLISLQKDIRRVFQYHGAEQHKRCGTSFLLFVMIISMIFFLFVRTDVIWLRVASRILFVPFIAGISWEVIKWAGVSKSPIVKILSWPGFMMQKITTKEPDDGQIKVAIAALNGVLIAEGVLAEDADEISGDAGLGTECSESRPD
jgi:uncharacterized protein YqhQ